MPRLVMEANIAHLKERLANEANPEVIASVRKLLAEEKAKLLKYNAEHPKESDRQE